LAAFFGQMMVCVDLGQITTLRVLVLWLLALDALLWLLLKPLKQLLLALNVRCVSPQRTRQMRDYIVPSILAHDFFEKVQGFS
jgi:hypothetical protein